MAGLMQKFKDLWNPPEEEYDDYDYEEEEQQEPEEQRPRMEQRQSRASASSKREQPSARRSSDGKVVNLNPAAQLQVVIFKPEHFGEETCAVADELLHGNTVVLNLEDTQKDISRRIIDFLSGVAYANGGKIKRVATNTFILTPYNVDLMGEEATEDNESSGEYF